MNGDQRYHYFCIYRKCNLFWCHRFVYRDYTSIMQKTKKIQSWSQLQVQKFIITLTSFQSSASSCLKSLVISVELPSSKQTKKSDVSDELKRFCPEACLPLPNGSLLPTYALRRDSNAGYASQTYIYWSGTQLPPETGPNEQLQEKETIQAGMIICGNCITMHDKSHNCLPSTKD